MYLPHRRRQLGRGRRRVRRDRHAAERRHHFGEDGAIERDARDREAGRRRRMRVHDRLHVRALAIHLEVHQHLGRRIAIALNLFAVEIGDAHHVGRHESLAHALGRHQQPIRSEPDADVPVVRRRIPARVHAPADLDDVGAQRRPRCSCGPGPVFIAAVGGTEIHAARSVGQRHRLAGQDERAAHRIAHHVRAALRRRARAPRPDSPSSIPSTTRQNVRAMKTRRSRTSAKRIITHQAFAPARPSPDAPSAGCRARAWRPALRGCRARAARPAARPRRPRRESCLPNALTMPTLSSVLVCFGSSCSDRANCSSALSG